MKVVVIGAGLAGLGIGWRLRRQGVEVTILDRAQPGRGASWAAAGMIAPAAELAGARPEEITLADHAAALWPDFAREVEEASGMAVGYHADGALFVVEDARGVDVLTARAAADPGMVLLDRQAAQSRVPGLSDRIAGGLWAPDEARVDNRALGRALAIAFEKAGGRIAANEALVWLERRAGRTALAHTPFGTHEADAFVLAAGAWNGQLEAIPVAPVKGQMIALAPPPGVPAPIGPVIWGEGVYAVPRGDRLLIGATVQDAGFDTSLDPEAALRLRALAVRLLPGLASWTVAEHWAGLRPRAPDGLPLLGPLSPGLFVAGGQYRNGVLYAPAIAEMMAAIITGSAAPVPAFDPRRFS